MERLNSGRNDSENSNIGLMKCGRAEWQEAEKNKSGQEIFHLRTLQGRSGRNLIVRKLLPVATHVHVKEEEWEVFYRPTS